MTTIDLHKTPVERPWSARLRRCDWKIQRPCTTDSRILRIQLLSGNGNGSSGFVRVTLEVHESVQKSTTTQASLRGISYIYGLSPAKSFGNDRTNTGTSAVSGSRSRVRKDLGLPLDEGIQVRRVAMANSPDMAGDEARAHYVALPRPRLRHWIHHANQVILRTDHT